MEIKTVFEGRRIAAATVVLIAAVQKVRVYVKPARKGEKMWP